MKETAVEWLYKWLNDNQEATIEEGLEAFNKAKSIEKEQHKQTFKSGWLRANAMNYEEKFFNYYWSHEAENIQTLK